MLFILVLLAVLAAAGSVPTDNSSNLIIKSALDELCGPHALPNDTPISSSTLGISLQGSGFHRSLRFAANFSCSRRPAAAEAPPPQCEIALLQPLPAVIYANIYELENAAAAGHGPAVRLFGEVDVESIEQLSQPSVLAVFASLPLSQGSSCGSVEATVVLHGRYPRPVQAQQQQWQRQRQRQRRWFISPTVEVDLEAPAVLVRCLKEGQWMQLKSVECNVISPWRLPTGDLSVARWVAAVTAGVVLAAAAAVLWTVATTTELYPRLESSAKRRPKLN